MIITKIIQSNQAITLKDAVIGAVIAFFSMIFGEHWILFAVFLLFNVVDYITGWMKAKMANKINSTAGLIGILKKLGYWIMIMVSFLASVLFIEIGNTLGIDLGITTLLGWFVLASLTINELRSIIENLVETGYNIPNILTKGLEVADKIINEENK
ncbi:phage holin family protein [Thomasclavelia cocleata]|jgi:toxin secretion/phage lysis holin|uniref:phage holin family protein n=1 Tax=Thomasclavelia cocleata TaxID=69824 RepID=UPI00242ECEB5|nr:phage holin family protein [Thomasclavelia cocleata]MCI9130909.1 phage holin family protein [Thomasclavelia cocleata]